MKSLSLYIMALVYFAAGLIHLVHPQTYRKIMPQWLPWHDELILLSGILEILFASLLLFPKTRRIGAMCIIALLVAVFPANIQMMFNYFHEGNPGLWLAVVRLPLQIVLIWWAYRYTAPPH